MKTVESKEFENASAGDQSIMVQEALDALNTELHDAGFENYYFNHFAGVQTTLMDLEDEIGKNQDKLNEYNTELLEYAESAAAYKKAVRDIIGLNISDIPTESLAEFAAVAKSIGEQAANAELEAYELERYAEELTEVARAAGLLPENQKITFNADGALNVIEAVAGELTDLDGQSAEVIVEADSDSAKVKINDVMYKVLQYDATTGIATLSADGKTAFGQIDLVTGELREFDEAEAEAYLYANTEDAETNIKNAKSELDGIKDKTVTITTVFKSVYEKVKSALGFAKGTENAPPGAHWVGEQGPELLWFHGGEKVLDAQRSAAYAKEHSRAMSRDNALSAKQGYGQTHTITISPVFHISGEAPPDTEQIIRKCSAMLIDEVMDVLEESGIDAKRGAYV